MSSRVRRGLRVGRCITTTCLGCQRPCEGCPRRRCSCARPLTHGRARRVRLHVADVRGVHPRARVHLPHQPLLRRRRRRNRRGLRSVSAGAAANDVAVRSQRGAGQCGAELGADRADRQEEDRDRALGAHEAVGAGVEGARVAGGGNGAAGQGAQEDVAGEQRARPLVAVCGWAPSTRR
jgi:hypothetical protein